MAQPLRPVGRGRLRDNRRMSKNLPAGLSEFEPEFVAGLRTLFEDRIVVNHLLGLASTRMEFLGTDGKLLCTGSAASIVS